VNPKTVAKWRRRRSLDDLPMGPHERSALSELEEAAVAFHDEDLRAMRRRSWRPG
jgi:hypothetical protein